MDGMESGEVIVEVVKMCLLSMFVVSNRFTVTLIGILLLLLKTY